MDRLTLAWIPLLLIAAAVAGAAVGLAVHALRTASATARDAIDETRKETPQP